MHTRKEFWSGRPVLVTGSSGFLGSWLTAALAEAGAKVICLVRGASSIPPILAGCMERVTLVHGNVTDQELIERTLHDQAIDSLFHAAAQTIVGTARQDPAATFETNVQGTWTVFEAARRAPSITRVVMASSDKAYGDNPQLPFTEETPLLGRYPYEASKACADLIAQSYAATYSFPVGITRCANFFGGGDLNWSRIVPGTIRSLIQGEPVVIRSDGTPQRDYIYIEDAVNAYLCLAEQLENPAVKGQVFNFGLDKPVTVLEIVRAVIAASGNPEIEPQVLGEASHEIQAQYLDSSKARRMLKWKPAFPLDAGLRATFEWYREYLKTS